MRRVGHLPPAVEVYFADIRDRGALERAFEGARWVYHLAANPNLWVRDRGEFDAVNYRGTVNVLDAALAAGAERVLHTSTESILTKAQAAGPINENIEISLSDAVGPYCRSKLLAEQYALFLAGGGLPVVVANPTMPVGPGDRNLSPPTRLVLDFCRGDLPAMMECTLNLIDVRDVAHRAHAGDGARASGPALYSGKREPDAERLAGDLSELTGVPVPRWRVPYGRGAGVCVVVGAVGRPGERAGTPKATMTGVRLGKRIMHFDSSREPRGDRLGARPIRGSLVEAVEWLREAGHLRVTSERVVVAV